MVKFDLCEIVIGFVANELVVVIYPILILYCLSRHIKKIEGCAFPICIKIVILLKY